MTDLNTIYSDIEAGGVIVNIGNIDVATARTLDKLVKAGTLAKWRGYWFPVAGAQFGIGPLKTCWALPHIKEQVSNIG
jgi:hypothetical protein